MSIHVMSWVMKHSDARLGNRLVLIALAEHAHDDGGSAWPSVATLAERANLSERQVQYALRSLEEAGSIEKTGATRKGTNVYRVLMEGGANTAPLPEQGGAVQFTGGVQPTAPDPSLEPSTTSPSVSPPSQQIVAGYVDQVTALGAPAPKRVVGQVAKSVKELLDEGVDPPVVERAVALMVNRRLNPATLPTLVLEAAAGPRRQEATRYGRGMTTRQILDMTQGAPDDNS